MQLRGPRRGRLVGVNLVMGSRTKFDKEDGSGPQKSFSCPKMRALRDRWEGESCKFRGLHLSQPPGCPAERRHLLQALRVPPQKAGRCSASPHKDRVKGTVVGNTGGSLRGSGRLAWLKYPLLCARGSAVVLSLQCISARWRPLGSLVEVKGSQAISGLVSLIAGWSQPAPQPPQGRQGWKGAWAVQRSASRGLCGSENGQLNQVSPSRIQASVGITCGL